MKAFLAKSTEASRLRQRKYSLVRQFNLPEDLVGGSFGPSYRRCGKPNCHCINDRGHVRWAITSSHQGKKRVELVPREWIEDVEQAVLETQAYLEAVKELMNINVELLAQSRNQMQQRKVRRKQKLVKK